MKDNRLNSWYRQQADKVGGPPPSDLWQGIAAELDATPKAMFPVWARWTSAVFLLILTASITWAYWPSDTIALAESTSPAAASQEGQLAHNGSWWMPVREDASVQSLASTTSQGIEKAETPAATNSFLVSSEPSATPAVQASVNTGGGTTSTSTSYRNSSSNVRAEPKLSFSTLSLMPPSNGAFALSQEVKGSNVRIKPPRNREGTPQGYYIGASLSANNLWTINHATRKGFDANSLKSNSAKFSRDYALVFGRQVSARTAFQAEMFLQKSQGQITNDYEEGRFTRTDLELDYSRIGLHYVRKITSQFMGYSANVNGVLGAYVGYLKSASEMTGDADAVSILDKYRKVDAGLDLGLEYEVFVNDQWAVGAAARNSIGLTNAFSGDDKNPAHFLPHRNLSFGLSFNVKYVLGTAR